jgi:transposase
MEDQRKRFRVWDPLEGREEIVSPAEQLPENDLVYFLLDVVGEFDLTEFHAYYSADTRGQPPYNVPMMLVLLMYSYCVGVFSSRKIAAACERNLAFIAIVGSNPPNFRTICNFRKNHAGVFQALFIEVLKIACDLNMVRLGNISTDGTKIKANASRHKAVSYDHACKKEKELEAAIAEIQERINNAERIDAEEDAAHGTNRGDELPEELRRREERLQKIREAKERLEAQSRAEAEELQRKRDEEKQQREAEGKKRGGRPAAPLDSTPEDKAQTNFTDSQSRIMKVNNKGFDQCYNAQAVVDSENQIILAAEVTAETNDKKQAVPLAQATKENLRAAECSLPCDEQGQPKLIPNTADNGYYSETNTIALERLGFDPHLSVGREKCAAPTVINDLKTQSGTTPTITSPGATKTESGVDGDQTNSSPPKSPKKPSAARQATIDAKLAMQKKLQTPEGKKLYAARKGIVEPVFGQIKGVRGFRQFLLRGLNLAAAEWKLICLTHNLLKIWQRKIQIA